MSPQCPNGKPANIVCLYSTCEEYPFFCTSCQSEECEEKHLHGDRLSSVSFKELMRRVNRERKPSLNVEKALAAYQQCLHTFQRDVQQFVQKQISEMEQVRQKLTQIDEQEQQTIAKLKKQEYQELTGHLMDELWSSLSVVEQEEVNQEIISFYSMKQNQITEISHTFSAFNQMQLNTQQIKKKQKPNQLKQNPQEEGQNQEENLT